MSEHVSFSQLNMVLKCGEQYRRRYVNGEILPPSGALVRGRCGHKALEKNYKQKEESRADLVTEEIVQEFVDRWEQERYGIVYTEDELDGRSPSVAEGFIREAGIGMVAAYQDDPCEVLIDGTRRIGPPVGRHTQPAPGGTEEAFEVFFHGDFPKLIGYIDLRDEHGIIRETKFMSKSPPADAALSDDQLTCYDLGYRTKYGKPPAGIVKTAAVATKKPKVVSIPCPARGQEQTDRFLRRLEKGIEAIRAGLAIPAPSGVWWCSWKFCGYYSTCKVRP